MPNPGGLDYGGLVPGPEPHDPLTGRKLGQSTDQLELFPGGRVVAKDGVETKTVAGAPADSDFDETPADGTLAVDTTNNAIYVRIGGTWLSVGVA